LTKARLLSTTGPPDHCLDPRDWHEAAELLEALEEAARSSEWRGDLAAAARKTRPIVRDEA
jgi:hypothetical protein